MEAEAVIEAHRTLSVGESVAPDYQQYIGHDLIGQVAAFTVRPGTELLLPNYGYDASAIMVETSWKQGHGLIFEVSSARATPGGFEILAFGATLLRLTFADARENVTVRLPHVAAICPKCNELYDSARRAKRAAKEMKLGG